MAAAVPIREHQIHRYAYALFQVQGEPSDLEEIIAECDYHFDHEAIRDTEILGVDADSQQLAVRLTFESVMTQEALREVMESADYEFVGLQTEWDDIATEAPGWL